MINEIKVMANKIEGVNIMTGINLNVDTGVSVNSDGVGG